MLETFVPSSLVFLRFIDYKIILFVREIGS